MTHACPTIPDMNRLSLLLLLCFAFPALPWTLPLFKAVCYHTSTSITLPPSPLHHALVNLYTTIIIITHTPSLPVPDPPARRRSHAGSHARRAF